MEYFSRIVLMGCVLGFSTLAHGESIYTATYPLKNQGATCNQKIRVIFTSDRWTSEMNRNTLPSDLLQDEFLLGIMEQIVISAKESGIRCTFDKFGYVLTCCDSGNLDQPLPPKKRELTRSEKFWGFDFSHANFIFLIVNLFFFVFIMAWGFVLTLKYPETLQTLGRPEISGTTG